MLNFEYFVYHTWSSRPTGKHPRRSGLHYKRRKDVLRIQYQNYRKYKHSHPY